MWRHMSRASGTPAAALLPRSGGEAEAVAWGPPWSCRFGTLPPVRGSLAATSKGVKSQLQADSILYSEWQR